MKENKWLIFVLTAVMLILCLTACSAERYHVDYSGAKDLFEGAKDSYKAGAEVTLTFPYVATDTDYSFYLDGDPLPFTYDDQKGFIITFTMPDHDVKIDVDSRNSMLPYEGGAE